MESDKKPGLWLLIEQKWYLIERLTFDEPTAFLGWKLKPWEDPHGHGPYNVVKVNSSCYTCECADFTMQKQKIGELCKHIIACRKVGLI